ncbi:MAG: DNA repair protein RecN [Pyrinomonadaceae bacterium]
MLSLLKIKNIALIDELTVEFGKGLNLLTGETGSGKSIIVDSLGALIGDRVSNDLIKQGEELAQIEGLFNAGISDEFRTVLEDAGITLDDANELIVKREISAAGRNRVFLNNQLITQNFLKKIGVFLAGIHGQGEQFALYSPASHLEMLDGFAGLQSELMEVSKNHASYVAARKEVEALNRDESEKLRMADILRFQIGEIEGALLKPGEDEELLGEKRLLSNAEKITILANGAYFELYESEDAVIATLERVAKKTRELAEFESGFGEFNEGIEQADAVLQELAFSLRDFAASIEFSAQKLNTLEDRLAEIETLKRKYGGSVESALNHLAKSREELNSFESSEEFELVAKKKFETTRSDYLNSARKLSEKRKKAAKKFEAGVTSALKDVALEKAKFEVRFGSVGEDEKAFTVKGIDAVEFYFTANPGEAVKPLAKVASGGEASRLMLIIKLVAGFIGSSDTSVFDEIDAGIGGRVAEAVGLKLRELSKRQQVLCVTHQPQVAALANLHFVVEKTASNGYTHVFIKELNKAERIEEVARMLAGENVTKTAREHAKELLTNKE